mgnify:CR=1 FL=1
MITRDMEGEVRFLKNRYRSMRNRVQFSRSYRDIENEYESEEAFIEHWKGRVDWEANPHLDRIDSDGNYCKSNNQWLSAEEHRLKSAKEAAKLTDKQALEVIKAGKPCRVAGRENNISHMTAHKILKGESYRWLLREEENENGNGRLGI